MALRGCAALVAALVTALALPGPAAAAERCGAFERLTASSPPGTCVAVLADRRDGLRMPRRVIEIAPGRWWITDMGNWEPRRGRLLELRVDPATGSRRIEVLAEQLDRPHGLARGPDGKVYVGEAGSVWRTDPAQPGLKREPVLTGLPADGAHPLKELAFAPTVAQGVMTMYVNVGSASDACRDDRQRQALPCPDRIGALPRAAVYRAELPLDGGAPRHFGPHALGLRNSMALAVDARGTLWQGENSIDYPDEKLPPETLNRLRAGSDHGWPYCIAPRQPARGYEGRARCRDHEAPALLLPAHAAPLGLVQAPAQAVAGLAGRLVMSWHGHRAAGRRIVSIGLDGQGRAVGPPRPLVWDWQQGDGGGAPVGVAFDAQGRLLFTEDRHRRVLMLMADSR